MIALKVHVGLQYFLGQGQGTVYYCVVIYNNNPVFSFNIYFSRTLNTTTFHHHSN